MKTKRLLPVLLLAVIAALVLGLSGAVLADDTTTTTPPPPATAVAPSIALSTDYPTIEALSTSSFQFNVDMTYKGSTDRVFDIRVVPPQGWSIAVSPLYDTSKNISSILMNASDTGKTNSIQITANGYNAQPAPGDYVITCEVSSGEVTGKINLTARVTARYSLQAEPADNLYSLTAKGGKDNVLNFTVTNTGSSPIDNINFTADQTSGWVITFLTDAVNTLGPGASRNISVNIKPAAKTVSGDYMVNIYVSGKQASADKMAIRVTVETSSLWGTVGVIIILIVVVGLIFTFIRFGRR